MSISKSLTRDIRLVLMQDWDPIGIADIPEASDEYDSYIPELARAIMRKGSADDLARVLLSAEQNMSLEPKAERALEVAGKLLRINLPS